MLLHAKEQEWQRQVRDGSPECRKDVPNLFEGGGYFSTFVMPLRGLESFGAYECPPVLSLIIWPQNTPLRLESSALCSRQRNQG